MLVAIVNKLFFMLIFLYLYIVFLFLYYVDLLLIIINIKLKQFFIIFFLNNINIQYIILFYFLI